MKYRHRLLALQHAEAGLRAELAAAGALDSGYHERLRELHEANARELELIIDDEGWPTADVAGADGAEAAWMVAMHAISRPAFMRRCLGMIKAAALRGQLPSPQAAMLEDRIRVMEGRSQPYGTQLDWDGEGRLAPMPIEDPDGVDARRAAVGLRPLAETIATARAAAQSDGEPPPEEWEARYRTLEAFAKQVGWRP